MASYLVLTPLNNVGLYSLFSGLVTCSFDFTFLFKCSVSRRLI